MTQSFELRYILNFGNAKKDLTELITAEDRLGKAAVGASFGVSQLESSTKRLQATVFAARSLLQEKVGSLKGMQEAASKSAGAMAALSVAAGQGDSQMAKLVQSGAAVASAFAVNPLVGIATTAAFAWSSYSKTVEEAERANNVWRESSVALSAALRIQAEQRVRPAADALERYSAELRNFGKTSREVALDEAKLDVAIEQGRLFRAERQRDRLLGMALEAVDQAKAVRDQFGAGSDEFEDARDRARVADTVYKTANEQVRNLSKSSEDARQRAGALATTLSGLATKEAGATAAKTWGDAWRRAIDGVARASADAEMMWRDSAPTDAISGMMRTNKGDLRGGLGEAARAAAAAAADAALEADITAGAARADAARSFERTRTSILEEALAERTALETAQAKTQGDLYASMAAQAASSIGAGIVAGIQGQEDALAATLGALSQQAGGYIMLEGGKVLATGIAGALLGNPAAPGQIAGGAAIVAAGVAVQQGGPAAINALLGAGRGGGGGGAAAREVGARRSAPPTSSSSPQPTVINITYGGPTGPVAEKVAKTTASALATHNKRGGRNR